MIRVVLSFCFGFYLTRSRFYALTVFYLPRSRSSFLLLPLLPFSELVKTNQFDILGRSK